MQAAEQERSGRVLRSVDLAHASQREGSGARKFDRQFQRPACSLDEAAQGREAEVGLALELDPRRLLDGQTLGELILAAFGKLAQSLKPHDPRCSLVARAWMRSWRTAARFLRVDGGRFRRP